MSVSVPLKIATQPVAVKFRMLDMLDIVPRAHRAALTSPGIDSRQNAQQTQLSTPETSDCTAAPWGENHHRRPHLDIATYPEQNTAIEFSDAL